MRSKLLRMTISLWKLVKTGFVMLALCAMGQSALAAGTAANTQLQNTVTVAYDNLASVAQTPATATAVITINLIQAAPTLTLNSTDPADTSANISEGQDVTINYQVTSNANGPDNYEIDFTEALTTLSASSIVGGVPETIAINELGATTVGAGQTFDNSGTAAGDCVLPGSGACTIEVPNDITGVTGVNEIIGTDIVLINNGSDDLFCIVDSVGDGNQNSPYDPGVTFSTIVVSGCTAALNALGAPDGGSLLGSTYVVAAGDDIFETKDFDVVVTIGGITAGSTGQTVLTAQAETVTNQGSNQSGTVPVTIVIAGANLDIHKFVRNISTPAAGDTGSAFDVLTMGGNTFYSAGVTALPGETLEYAILMINLGGEVKDVVATDPSVTFTVYTTTSGAGTLTDGIVLYTAADITSVDCDTGGDTCQVTGLPAGVSNADDTLATASDIGGINAGVVTIYAGTGGNEAAAGDKGGNIALGKVSAATYRVEVD